MALTEAAAVTIVAVAGRLDIQTAEQFSHRVGDLLHAGHSQLLIEASQLSYISGAGIHALLLATKSATDKGARLAVCGLSAPTRHVLEIAGLGEAFESYLSREEALAKLAAN
jgi:anti-anti-sigma factor